MMFKKEIIICYHLNNTREVFDVDFKPNLKWRLALSEFGSWFWSQGEQ